MADLIDRAALGIGMANSLVFDKVEYAHGWNCAVEIIQNAPAVDAVPIDEMLELRNSLYETDKITMNGLKMLNELIAKYDGGRKEDGC